jgi:hypothetical protein
VLPSAFSYICQPFLTLPTRWAHDGRDGRRERFAAYRRIGHSVVAENRETGVRRETLLRRGAPSREQGDHEYSGASRSANRPNQKTTIGRNAIGAPSNASLFDACRNERPQSVTGCVVRAQTPLHSTFCAGSRHQPVCASRERASPSPRLGRTRCAEQILRDLRRTPSARVTILNADRSSPADTMPALRPLP